MYVQTFSVVVSQVKPGSQGPHNVLQFFLEVSKGCLTSVHKPVCRFCLHMVISQFPFASASCVSARKLGEVNRNQLSKSMPCGAISRCLRSVHFLKNIVQSFEVYSRTGADLGLQGRELSGTSPSAPLPGLSGGYPRLGACPAGASPAP